MPRRSLLLLLVFVVGCTSLGGEIAAARLLAPWFGDSTLIWANTIATVLLALSAGYWLGGKLADRDPSVTRLSWIVLGAAGLFALVPFVAGPFLRASVNAFDSLSAGAFVGSLFAVLVLLALPMLLLGTVAPYAIRLAVTRVEEAGTIAGRLYALSTLGSLSGVFLSALLLIPVLGTQRTFLVYALALATVAVVSLPRRWALAPAAVAALIAIPVGTVKATGDGRVIWEKETPYQYARVIEDPDGERRLELNEGQAVHSVYHPNRLLTGNYWDEFLVLPFATHATPPRSVAIIGNAAGTTARQYAHFFPETRVDGVELDAALNEVGVELFDLRGENLHLHAVDGRAFLRRSERRWDAIFVDAYRQPYVPFHLATREFFTLVRDRLTPGGVVLLNVGHPEGSDALEKTLGATMGDVFANVARDPSQDVNTILVAADVPIEAELLWQALPTLPPALRPVGARAAERLEPALEGGSVYTDDRAPVEWLIDASIVEVAASGER